MATNMSALYFRFVIISLDVFAAFPEKSTLKTRLRYFLLYKVWPNMFVSIWVPLVPMVTLKIFQLASQGLWVEFLDIMHMYLVGCNSLYLLVATHRSSTSFKNGIQGVKDKFKVWKDVSIKDMYVNIVVLFMTTQWFFFYVTGTIYYGEVLVPLWIPFTNNSEEYSELVYAVIWIYEGVAGVFIFAMYGTLFPFNIFMTTVIIKELNFLIHKLRTLNFDKMTHKNIKHKGRARKKSSSVNKEFQGLYISEEESKIFIKEFVEHHKDILKVTRELSKVHSNMFLTLTLMVVFTSCFLAFNMYYTKGLTKVLVKSIPILAFSYYLLFAFCQNGQRLTDKYEELFRSLYLCPWYDAPHNFKTSLLIIMSYCYRPVVLSGGGIFKASLHSFSHGLQQSISYVLFLKQMTPEK